MTKRTDHREPIAIVGMGCRLPGGIESPQAFWDFLCRGGDAIRDVPADRWDADALFAKDPAAPGRSYARRGGFVDGIDQFDPQFFGISPREAAHIDPQQRLLLETAHAAMQDAGQRWDDAAVRNTGVFVGVFIHDYQHMQFADRELLSAHTGTGTAMSIAANRISYVFDLHGPSLAVDTACSSSLVAVDLACKAISNGECDFALAGGVNVILKPEMTIAMSKATMLSRDGSCKSFAAAADGYVRGEGAGVVFLKKVSAAIAAGDSIYAVILGSGVNSDGQTQGISVPSGAAQEALAQRVLKEAGLDGASIDYVEAHGTGTPVGDPIEAGALGRVFSAQRKPSDGPVLLGSVKTNIGHLESASGVAGLIKVALSLSHGEIPASLHFDEPNPAIDFERLQLEVVQSRGAWPRKDHPRRAAVNSFGFGGTNAHVILEEAPVARAFREADDSRGAPYLVLPMGVHDRAALPALAQQYADVLAEPAHADDLLYTATQRRSHGDQRAAIVAKDSAELRERLSAFAVGKSPAGLVAGQRHENFDGKPVFVFSGMGPQWWAMGRELLQQQPIFRREVERVDAGFLPLTGWSVIDELCAEEGASRIHATFVAQPAIFAIQVGLVALFKHWGIEPGAVIGHSVGEAAALYSAGVLSLADAITVIYHRSRLQHTTAGTGTMLAVGVDLARANQLLQGLEQRVAIAAINSLTSLTLSGHAETLEAIRQRLEAEGSFARWLSVEVPYHSPQMQPIEQELLRSLEGLCPAAGSCKYYSSIDLHEAPSARGGAQYWWRNVRQTVLFAAAMDAALADGHACFLEIGPHPVLRAAMLECLAERKVTGTVTASLRRAQSDFDSLGLTLGELHVAGASIAWERIVKPARVLRLPPYPWQRTRHWSESAQVERSRKGLTVSSKLHMTQHHHTLLGDRLDLPAPTWLQTVSLSEHGYLQDHKVQGAVVFPGTGYLEMALQTLVTEAAESSAEPRAKECWLLSDVEIGRALYLTPELEARLETTRQGDRWAVHGHTGEDGSWVRHASGRCRREKLRSVSMPLDVDTVRARCTQQLPADYAYRLFRDVGLEYGPTFRAIEELWYGPREALARLTLPAELATSEATGFLFHPALLDACLHTLFGALNLNGEDADCRGNVFLPVSVRQLRVYDAPTATLFSHARLHGRASQHFEADVRIYDENLRLIAEVIDLRCQALEHPKTVEQARRREWLLEYAWDAQPLPKTAAQGLSGHWLVLVPSEDHPLVQQMLERGAQCSVALPESRGGREHHARSAQDFAELLTTVQAAGPLRGIVHAWSFRSTESVELGADWQAQTLGSGSLLQLVQALALRTEPSEAARGGGDQSSANSNGAEQPALWVLTERTQAVTAQEPIALAHSTLWGLRRVIANEHPHLGARIIDLDGSAAGWSACADELATAPPDDELALRDGARFVHRLRRFQPAETPTVAPAAGDAREGLRIELDVHKPGDLNSMTWVPLPKFEIRAHEVEIEVASAGLNFKDVIKASGLFPLRLIEGNLWSKATLGMECAGRITRLGADVTHVRVGDEVLALAPRCYASHVLTHGALVVPNPGLPHALAAGIPVAFLTAVVGLELLANLRAGERVLIHAASGGVGQAAIQVAQQIGAEIYATAGSEAKRQRVRELGVQHVFDSRSLGFAEAIREATGGAGVDVVLNSLAGDAITESVSILSDYGRFIELGKMDLDKDFRLGLRPFTRCLSFHSVDLDRMLAQRVETCGLLLAGIQARFAAGSFKPVPVSVYATSDVSSAFREMAGAKHTGKLIVDIAANQVAAQRRVAFRSDASYIISGGLGGFGLELAAWMAARGAGNLVLLGRRGSHTPGAEAAVARLRALGARVQIEACDVANAQHVAAGLAAVPAEFPLRGIFHAAAVLDDALIENLDLDRYKKTFAPKAMGAWNLHQQTLHQPLDYFMCFSSMASVLGNQGSANYCAANAFVDALAHHRRQRGLPALTVNWGVIADVGMAADEDFYRQNLERNGLRTMHSSQCLELLALLIEQDRVQTTVCPIDLETWLKFNPAGGAARLQELLDASLTNPDATRTVAAAELQLRTRLAELDPAARTAQAHEAIRQVLAQVFRIDAEKIEPSRSLTALGADSLMAIEIKNRLDGLGLAMSVTQLLNRNSVSTLAERLLAALGFAGGAEAGLRASVATEPNTSSWFTRWSERPDAKLRLFCFPYAGGGPTLYHPWVEALPDWIEVIAVCLPGRGARTHEQNTLGIAEMADAIVPELRGLLDRPFAFFGHCMGAILMYEVAQRLERQHGASATHIFASGCMAPHLYNSPIVHEQDDETFLNVLRLISFAGTRALVDDAELRAATFPMLRNDFRAVVEYGDGFRFESPLRAAITGLAADHDLFAAPKAMQAWDKYTTQGYELAQLPGDHYFIESERATVTRIVGERLAQSLQLTAATPIELPRGHWRKPYDCELGRPPQPARVQRTLQPRASRDSALQVLCFAPAGIRADEYPLPSLADPAITYLPIEWHGPIGAQPPRSVQDMVQHAYAAIGGKLTRRTMFYGHCLGAIVAYELALRLQRDHGQVPEHLLVAGVVGPHLYVAPDAHELPAPKLLELLAVLRHPCAARLQSDPDFQRARLPQLRADLEAMASYQYQQTELLAAPITALAFRHDLWSYPLRTGSWQRHTQEHCELVHWDGDHYQSMQHPDRIHDLLSSFAFAAIAAE